MLHRLARVYEASINRLLAAALVLFLAVAALADTYSERTITGEPRVPAVRIPSQQ